MRLPESPKSCSIQTYNKIIRYNVRKARMQKSTLCSIDFDEFSVFSFRTLKRVILLGVWVLRDLGDSDRRGEAHHWPWNADFKHKVKFLCF